MLPGFLLTNIFNGVVVAFIFCFFGYYLTTLGFFYHAMRRLITAQVALFAPTFLATSTFIIGNFSTTLSEVPGISFDAVSLYFVAYEITRPTRTRAFWPLFVSGIFAGLAIHCHLVFVPYVCANYAIFVCWKLLSARALRQRWTEVLLGALSALTGIVFITIVLGLILVVAFRGHFVQIFNDFAYIAAAENSLDRSATIGWLWKGAEVGMTVTACLISLITIVGNRGHAVQEPELRNRLVAVSVSVLTLSTVLLAYSAFGGPFVAYSSYFVCFLPYLGLVLFPPLIISAFSGDRLVRYVAIFYAASLALALVREYLGYRGFISNLSRRSRPSRSRCFSPYSMGFVARTGSI